MMTWNYRVVRTVGEDEEWFTIHEVYYNEDGSIEALSEEAMEPAGESQEELRNDLDHMIMALSQPILENETGRVPVSGLAAVTRQLSDKIERLENDINEWKTLEAKARGERDALLRERDALS